MLEPGREFGGVRLVRCLSTGGLADVWRAERPDGTPVAVRALVPSRLGAPRAQRQIDEAFAKRIQWVRMLEHPGLAAILDTGVVDGVRYVITEFIDGLDLARLLTRAARTGDWPPRGTALHIGRECAHTLAYIHSVDLAGHRLIHGSITPAKIMLARDGRVVLVDAALHPHTQLMTETASHQVTGQLAYLSPEQAKNPDTFDARSDVFRLGIVLWELLCRSALFRRSSDLETIQAIAEAKVPPPPTELGEAVSAVLLRCLAKQPSDRYESADALARALDRLADPPEACRAQIAALLPLDTPQTLSLPAEVDSESARAEMARDTQSDLLRAPPRDETVNQRGAPEPPSETNPFFDAARDLELDLGPRFEIVSRLGEGGMGEVYKATDRELGETVALKLITRNVVGDLELLDRLRREVRLARKIASPRVCRIYELVELPNRGRAVTMAYIRGKTIAGHLKEGVPVDYLRFAKWTRDIAEGLQAAHDMDIVHRDLKPENVMITDEDRAIILDFGVAYSSNSQLAGDKLTRKGVILGTLPYMAPEQLTAAPLDGRADLYALGLILAELITGEVPFSAKTYNTALELRVLKPKHYEIEAIDPGVPSDLSELQNQLLRSDRELRPRTAGEVVRRLDAIIQRMESGAPPPPKTKSEPAELPAPPARARAATWGLVSLGALVTVSLGLFLVVGPKAESRPAATDAAVREGRPDAAVREASADAAVAAPPPPETSTVEVDAGAPERPDAATRRRPKVERPIEL